MLPNSIRLVSSWKGKSLIQGQTQTKGRRWRDRDTEKAIEDEGRDWSEASTSQRLPVTHQKLGESTGLTPPHSPQKELTLLTPCFWTSSLQNCGVILSHPVVDNCFSCTRKWIQTSLCACLQRAAAGKRCRCLYPSCCHNCTKPSSETLDFVLKAAGSHWNIVRGGRNDQTCVLNAPFGCSLENRFGKYGGGKTIDQ